MTGLKQSRGSLREMRDEAARSSTSVLHRDSERSQNVRSAEQVFDRRRRCGCCEWLSSIVLAPICPVADRFYEQHVTDAVATVRRVRTNSFHFRRQLRWGSDRSASCETRCCSPAPRRKRLLRPRSELVNRLRVGISSPASAPACISSDEHWPESCSHVLDGFGLGLVHHVTSDVLRDEHVANAVVSSSNSECDAYEKDHLGSDCLELHRRSLRASRRQPLSPCLIGNAQRHNVQACLRHSCQR